MIGEVGLDFYFVENKSKHMHQELIFEYFLQAASSKRKIANIHTKGAEHRVLELLEKYQIGHSIIHWYSGPLNLIERYLSIGSYFSIGAELFFSEHITNLLAAIPDDRILTETDNPGGYRWLTKQTGMPYLIGKVVGAISGRIKLTVPETKELVCHNFETLIKQNVDMSNFVDVIKIKSLTIY